MVVAVLPGKCTWYVNCCLQFIAKGRRAFHSCEKSKYVGNCGLGDQGACLEILRLS